jgi:multidrug efflux pump subunit AcrB
MSGQGSDLEERRARLEQARREALRLKMLRRPLGTSGRIARAFLDSKLTPLLVVASLLLGAFAVMVTPREEEPQIEVPMIDVFVGLPGASATDLERRVIDPLAKALYEIPGVEYLYSTARPSEGILMVRFLVGSDPDQAVLRVHAKVAQVAPELPPGSPPPLVVPRGIDDVPVVAYTFWSRGATPLELRRVAAELGQELSLHPRVARVTLLGGHRRVVQVSFDRQRLAAHQLSLVQVQQALGGLDFRLPAGSFSQANVTTEVEVGSVFRTADEVAAAVVGSWNGRPVHLRDVARVADGPEEPTAHVWMMAGAAAGTRGLPGDLDVPAVTLAVAKKPGTNAIDLVNDLDLRIADLQGSLVPGTVEVTKTRDYGFTAHEKSSELMKHLVGATFAVVLLMALALGRREAIVVAVAIPTTLALTLASSYFFGYTLNRVTLFALIFAIGILVDDAIVVVENIHRHFKLGWAHPRLATVHATDEVGNPTILATFAVIAALLPLAFVSGLMGPYMQPIPINASAAMLFSLVVAFVVSPWVTYRLWRRQARKLPGARFEPAQETPQEGRLNRLYARLFQPLLAAAWRRWALLGGVAVLLLAAMALVPLRLVTMKMLPFDDKSEVQVIIDMPAGSTLEETAAVARLLAEEARALPEVTDLQVYAGTSSPFNFNGLVRRYFLRSGPQVADLQVNLVPKHDRRRASHPFAKELRERLQPLAEASGANVKVAEVPPGPPVLSTLVMEVYGPDLEQRLALAAQVRQVFETTPGVVDVDWLVDHPAPRLELEVDRAKAARLGISPELVARTLRLALDGAETGSLRLEGAREPVPLVLRLDRAQRSSLENLLAVEVPGEEGQLVALSELVTPRHLVREQALYQKNLQPVTYVIGEVAGEEESPVYGMLDMQERIAALTGPLGSPVPVLTTGMPAGGTDYALKWDGEWQITYEVFRDMGIAFAVVLVLIYLLVVGWFRSFVTPLIIMAPIPLTLIGILPAHAAGGVFFTATSMIGFIALAGIVVRNSILLVDFINLELASGESLEEAVIKAGVVRFRPIVLTAASLAVGGMVILLDPIFQGLALALISGVAAATALTLVVIPLLYYMYVKSVGVERVCPREDDEEGDQEPGPGAQISAAEAALATGG